ncbi:MAG: hypothetical protein ACMVO5_11155 [Polymorphobacter sp.]|uniref:hypothetical protein n=1 Tax=Polymorphobacter sp. TaxID=1909290 RepID=UPI003A88C316
MSPKPWQAAPPAPRPSRCNPLAVTRTPSSQRSLALVVITDDKPFLVDSIAAAVAAAGLESQRLLHPVVDVTRNADGTLISLHGRASGPLAPGLTRESIVCITLARANARARADLLAAIAQVLADVAVAVEDSAADARPAARHHPGTRRKPAAGRPPPRRGGAGLSRTAGGRQFHPARRAPLATRRRPVRPRLHPRRHSRPRPRPAA